MECHMESLSSYDLNLHIAAVFIVMVVSFLATLVPFAFKQTTRPNLSKKMLCFFKLFGAGNMLATAMYLVD